MKADVNMILLRMASFYGRGLVSTASVFLPELSRKSARKYFELCFIFNNFM